MLKTGATETRKRRCAGAYVWYSVRQDPQTGDQPYTDKSEWKDRSPNWQHLMTMAIGDSGTTNMLYREKPVYGFFTMYRKINRLCLGKIK